MRRVSFLWNAESFVNGTGERVRKTKSDLYSTDDSPRIVPAQRKHSRAMRTELCTDVLLSLAVVSSITCLTASLFHWRAQIQDVTLVSCFVTPSGRPIDTTLSNLTGTHSVRCMTVSPCVFLIENSNMLKQL